MTDRGSKNSDIKWESKQLLTPALSKTTVPLQKQYTDLLYSAHFQTTSYFSSKTTLISILNTNNKTIKYLCGECT